LADEHDRRGLLPFPEDSLRRVLPEVAGAAAGGFSLQLFDPHEDGESATDDPTHVNCLLKSTPSIFPRERRTRFWARIGRASASGRRNIMRISILTSPPSAAWSAGSYSIFSCTHQLWRSASGMASRSAGVGSTLTPPPAKEKSGLRTQLSGSERTSEA